VSKNLTTPNRRATLAFLAAGFAASAKAAEPEVRLFRVVTARDTITIGLTAGELAALGRGEAVTLLAEMLVRTGQITAWQYATGRVADGSLAWKPTARVAVLRADSLRIEPYVPALPLIAPGR
jgi:hypothetical protein